MVNKNWNSQESYQFELSDIYLRDITILRLLRLNADLRRDLKSLSKENRFWLHGNINIELEVALADARIDLYRADLSNATCLIPRATYTLEYFPQNELDDRIKINSAELDRYNNRNVNKISEAA
jgi:hypothetical protein